MNRLYIVGNLETIMSGVNQTVPEGQPRQLPDGTGFASHVSMKSPLRKYVGQKDGPVWQELAQELGITNPKNFLIAEDNGRGFDNPDEDVRKNLARFLELSLEEKRLGYWDLRSFGGTYLAKGNKKQTYAAAGGINVFPALSVAPVQIQNVTLTAQAIKDVDVKDDQDRGMAPGAWRVVEHGLYVFRANVCATRMHTSGCTEQDVLVFLKALPYLWSENPSTTRTCVRWITLNLIEHSRKLGGCPEHLIDAALAPRVLKSPPTKLADYEVPQTLPDDLKARVKSIRSLI